MTRSLFTLADFEVREHGWGTRFRWDAPLQLSGEWPGDFENFAKVRGFLVPKLAIAKVSAFLVAGPEDVARPGGIRPAELKFLIPIHAVVEIDRGSPTVRRLNIDNPRSRRNRVHGITPDLLARVPLRELAVRTVARLSLTDRQEAHYVIDPNPGSTADWWLSQDVYSKPMPVDEPPIPDLIDPQGRAWWRVVADVPVWPQLDKAKRPHLDGDFFREVLRVRTAAQEAGRRDTTQAVCDWYEERTGRRPGTSTARKWISAARTKEG